MKLCPKCKAKVDDFFTFCLSCGQDLTRVPDSVKSVSDDNLSTENKEQAPAASTESNEAVSSVSDRDDNPPIGAEDSAETSADSATPQDATTLPIQDSVGADSVEPPAPEDDHPSYEGSPSESEETHEQDLDKTHETPTDSEIVEQTSVRVAAKQVDEESETAHTPTQSARDPGLIETIGDDAPVVSVSHVQTPFPDPLMADTDTYTANDELLASSIPDTPDPAEAKFRRLATAESLDALPSVQGSQDQPGDARQCPGCGASVPSEHVFCGQCGYSFSSKDTTRSVHEPRGTDEPLPASGPVCAYLILINPDGSDGKRYDLREGKNSIGRGATHHTFPEDEFLDARHADIVIRQGIITIQDCDTLNGTFVRICEPTVIEHNDTFRLGQQLLRYEEADKLPVIPSRQEQGTELLGAPTGDDVWGRLVQLMAAHLTGNAYLLRGRFISMGREKGDILFGGDGYVSGRHAALTRRSNRSYLEDLGSSNGTYIRLKRKTRISKGDLILIGQQLFRLTV